MSASSDTNHHKKGLVVVGAGLMRTGTLSLKMALEKLLGGECYHMATVIQNPEHADFWLRLHKEEVSDDEVRAMMDNYVGAVDFPPCAFYQRLARLYPDAKVVLSVRDPKAWHRSFMNTIFQFLTIMGQFPFTWIRPPGALMGRSHQLRPKVLQILRNFFGPDCELSDEAAMIRKFEEHVQEVKASIPADRLLVFEAKDGWEPLCRHLGVPVPDEPYPHENSTAERAGMISTMRWLQRLSWAALVGLLAGGVYVGQSVIERYRA